MIEGLDYLKSKSGYSSQEKLENISRGKIVVDRFFKIKRKYKSKTAKQAEKQT